MKLVGLITEYNPFHNGHKYHIEKSLKATGADAAIVVMSGNYVQRGTPALMPKHLRAEMALHSGAAVVLELPVHYATGGAEYFARGVVTLFDKLNCIDTICFGCEFEDVDSLEKIARILSDEPLKYKEILQQNLRAGLSFPMARQEALQKYTMDESLSKYLSMPNSILGIEYIKALYQLKSTITWKAIRREGSHYHDNTLTHTYSSATAIRQDLEANGFDTDKLTPYVPIPTLSIFKEYYHTRFPIVTDDFSLLLKSRLLTETKESLLEYLDVSQELANRIFKLSNKFQSFSQFCDLLKSKDVTYTRISRALLHILLNIKKEYITLFSQDGTILYARILGFQNEYSNVLSLLNKQNTIPLIAKTTDANTLTGSALIMWTQDLFASNLYEAVISEKYNCAFQNDCMHQILSI